jgi:CheY-like chemotaxis protein
LAINARDAMPGGGVLEIVSSNVRITPQESLNAKGISPGEYVCLSVTDSGTGMTALTKEQAIEPFFTTKRVGQGTGLGLSMVYGFVSQSGGDIEIESEVGQGTTVNLYFPRNVIGTTASNPEDRETPAQTSRRLRVLVVGDEPMVLSLAERALQALQHEVITAEDGPQALQQLQADNKIDLLFTDLVMPNGMLGVELARLALELQPELKVLFTSGNPAMLPSDLREEMSRLGPILHKPWTRADLKKALIAALPG